MFTHLPLFKIPYSQSSRPDSNRRPTHYECVALPAEPRKHLEKRNRQISLPCSYDQSGNRTRVYAVRGRRLDRLTNWPYIIYQSNRGDGIRTHGLCVPNAALYQTEPRLDTFDSIIRIVEIVNTNFYNFFRNYSGVFSRHPTFFSAPSRRVRFSLRPREGRRKRNQNYLCPLSKGTPEALGAWEFFDVNISTTIVAM